MNMNVSLTDELVKFVKDKVGSGRYTSSSEVVREALRLLERADQEEESHRRWLQQAWRDGIASGKSAPLSLAAVKAEGRRRLGAKE